MRRGIRDSRCFVRVGKMTRKDVAMVPEAAEAPRFSWERFWERFQDRFGDFLKNRLALAGIIIVISVVGVALVAPLIQIHDPLQQNISYRLQTPSFGHFFGTDHLGRDVWSRIVHGARVALMVGIIAVGIGVIFGTPIGAISGYYRGKVDEVIMRIMDSLLAFPPILMALVVVTILGSSLFNTMLAIGVVYIPRFARVIRGSVLSEREKEYVEAGRMVGESNLSILFRQILPNSFIAL